MLDCSQFRPCLSACPSLKLPHSWRPIFSPPQIRTMVPATILQFLASLASPALNNSQRAPYRLRRCQQPPSKPQPQPLPLPSRRLKPCCHVWLRASRLTGPSHRLHILNDQRSLHSAVFAAPPAGVPLRHHLIPEFYSCPDTSQIPPMKRATTNVSVMSVCSFGLKSSYTPFHYLCPLNWDGLAKRQKVCMSLGILYHSCRAPLFIYRIAGLRQSQPNLSETNIP